MKFSYHNELKGDPRWGQAKKECKENRREWPWYWRLLDHIEVPSLHRNAEGFMASLGSWVFGWEGSGSELFLGRMWLSGDQRTLAVALMGPPEEGPTAAELDAMEQDPGWWEPQIEPLIDPADDTELEREYFDAPN